MISEFEEVLRDIDGLDGVPATLVRAYVDQEFAKADLNYDGFISIDEFALYYYAELCFKFPVHKNGHNPGDYTGFHNFHPNRFRGAFPLLMLLKRE